MKLVDWLDQKIYGNYSDNWDDSLFRGYIVEQLQNDYCVLDVGAGAGIVEEMHFRGKVKKICGIDLDPRVETNDKLDEGKIADAAAIPYCDSTFDVVFADNVMEHLENPAEVFSEVNRVLKPGGILLFKTPNKYHYMPLIAMLTPHAFHSYINKLRGREPDDTFPTKYLANSKAQISTLAEISNFELVTLRRFEGRPEYLRFTPFTYIFGLFYERIVNSSDRLEKFRILLIAVLRKKNMPPHEKALNKQV